MCVCPIVPRARPNAIQVQSTIIDYVAEFSSRCKPEVTRSSVDFATLAAMISTNVDIPPPLRLQIAVSEKKKGKLSNHVEH